METIAIAMSPLFFNLFDNIRSSVLLLTDRQKTENNSFPLEY